MLRYRVVVCCISWWVYVSLSKITYLFQSLVLAGCNELHSGFISRWDKFGDSPFCQDCFSVWWFQTNMQLSKQLINREVLWNVRYFRYPCVAQPLKHFLGVHKRNLYWRSKLLSLKHLSIPRSRTIALATTLHKKCVFIEWNFTYFLKLFLKNEVKFKKKRSKEQLLLHSCHNREYLKS